MIFTLILHTLVILFLADVLRHVVPLDGSTCSRAVRARYAAGQRARARARGGAGRPLGAVIGARA